MKIPVKIRVDGRCERIVFLDNGFPAFSWYLPQETDFRQCAYRIVAETEGHKTLLDTGRVPGRESQWIPWPGKPLPSRTCAVARVQLFGKDGSSTDFSESVCFETSLLNNSEWENACWIWNDRNDYHSTTPSPYFRKEFKVTGRLRKARLYVSARGCFNTYIDGEKISSDVLAPGWTDFRKRIPFMTYDVTEVLSEGSHVLGGILADGWCCGNLTIFRYRNVYHQHPEFLARLELFYDDGHSETIVSDGSWQCSTGAILSADLYDGTAVDGRLMQSDWCKTGFDCRGWKNAAVGESAISSPALIQKTAPAVRITESLSPVQILHPDKDTSIWDFGQNFTGIYKVRLRGNAGRLYTFRTAEVLKANGELYTANYRSAKSTDSYICHGPLEEWEDFSPDFTFHGFRYLQIDGYQSDHISPDEIEVTGLVLRSDMPVTADFSCGNPGVTKLWRNALWSQKGNFLEIPMDCPQRDERLGWTGDAQLFAPTAMYNADCCIFFRKYLADIRDAMQKDGAAPSMAPAVIRLYDGAACWGDALILIPYELYRHYGCTEILLENYEAMKRALLWQKEHSHGLLLTEKQFGDWLAPEATPRPLVATAYFYHCAKCFGEISGILGHAEDQRMFEDLSTDIRQVFRQAYLDKDGVAISRTQTALALVLSFGLMNEDEIPANAAALEKAVLSNGKRLSTGFIGTALLPQALAASGLSSLALDLVLQEEYPSWLYSVKQEATTIWENWNGCSPDGFADPAMNSFNHYAYGSVAGFLMNWVGGIHYSNRKLILKIVPDRRFSPVHAIYHSPHGRIDSQWEIGANGTLHWQVNIPCGLSASVQFPDGTEKELSPGHTVLL